MSANPPTNSQSQIGPEVGKAPYPVGDTQLLAALVESSDDAILSEDLNGIITTWNHGAQLIFGYKPEEIVGRHISVLIPPERWHEQEEIQRKILDGGVVKHFETIRLRNDGRNVEVSVTTSPIKAVDGQIVGLSKIARDIGERRKTEEQVRLMSAAVEAAANAIIITDRKGNIVWVNKAFERLTGFSAAEVIGSTPRMLKSGQEPEQFYQTMWKTISAGTVWWGDLINKRKDGSLYNESMMIAPMTDSSGTVTHYIAIKQDVTERIKAQEERERLIVQLKQALSDVKTLTGLLPICASCKKIRDDTGYWNQVEVYIRDRSSAQFTHGICPDCAQKLLAEFEKEMPPNARSKFPGVSK